MKYIIFCSVLFFLVATSVYWKQDNVEVWEHQLSNLKKDTLLLKEGISLINSEFVGIIDDSSSIESAILQLLDSNNYFPLVIAKDKQVLLPLKLLPLNIREQAPYSSKSILGILSSVVKIGQKIIRLYWQYNGEIITTLCVVDDSLGIIYDHILMWYLRPIKQSIKKDLYETDNVEFPETKFYCLEQTIEITFNNLLNQPVSEIRFVHRVKWSSTDKGICIDGGVYRFSINDEGFYRGQIQVKEICREDDTTSSYVLAWSFTALSELPPKIIDMNDSFVFVDVNRIDSLCFYGIESSVLTAKDEK